MRRSPLKPVRLAIAVVVLAGFTAALLDFRGLVPARVAHWLAAVQFTPSLLALGSSLAAGLVLLVILGVTLAFGRVYCSTVCPLGLLQDGIARLAAWLRPRRRSLPPAKPSHWLRYGMLVACVLTIAGGAASIAYAHADPYSIFGRIFSGIFRPLVVAANNGLVAPAQGLGQQWLYRVTTPWPGLGVLLPAGLALMVVAVLVLWRGRLYCNTLCPVGTVLGLLARHAAFRLTIDQSVCSKCTECLRSCKAQCLDLRTSRIDASRCVACYNCIAACADHGIAYRFAWTRPKAPQPATSVVALEPDRQRRALLAGALLLAPAVTLRAAESALPALVVGPRPPASPPGSLNVRRFVDRCTACQLCVSTCPTQVLQPAFLEYGFEGLAKPHLDFNRAFCNYDCRRCGEVCPNGAITLLSLAEKRLSSVGVAKFDQKRCIVDKDGTDCAACSEHCPTKAVFTVPFRTNLRLPKVNEELCIGCGACEYACPVRPVRAITVAARAEHAFAREPYDPPVAKPTTGDFAF